MSTDDSGTSSPFAKRGFIAAAAVVGVIVALGLFVLVMNLVSPPSTAPEPEPEPKPTTTSPVQSGDDASVCGLEGFETESSLEQAPDVEWELVGTVAVPVDSTVGPGVVDDDGFRSCFAHTAEGALYSAINYVALSSDPRLQPKIWQLFEEGPVRDNAKEESESGSGMPSSARLQVAGFKIMSYTGERAVIDVAWQVSSPASGIMSMPVELVWEEGDWYLATTDTGLPYAPSQIENLGGYIPWSGA
ncbi:MAG: hypothetical protein ACK5LO_09945 [Leucobacter sp.]